MVGGLLSYTHCFFVAERASMGGGLAGAIGAAMDWHERDPDRRRRQLHSHLALFVLANEGYAAQRVTQKQHFGGAYLCCDRRSGLGLPSWAKFFDAYGIPVLELEPDRLKSRAFEHAFERPGPHAFIVPVDVLRYLMAEAPALAAG